MENLIICFFTLFFVISFVGIVIKLFSICRKNSYIKIDLYEDGRPSVNLSNVYAGRLADTSVRSSVRYHKSLYKTYNDYEQYRESVRKLNLP